MSCYGCFCWWPKKNSDPPRADPPHAVEKPTATPADVLKTFEEEEIDKVDDFIKALKEQLERPIAHQTVQDAPSTSRSNTDKLSIWASVLQKGATFLQFASDHTEKIKPEGDFFHSGQVGKIAGEVLKEIGQLHWAVAGLSVVGYLVSKCHEVSENRIEFVDLLNEMLQLASHIKSAYNLVTENEKRKVLKQAFHFIVEGSIHCARQLDSGYFSSFLKTSINSDTVSGLRSKINNIYVHELQPIIGIETLVEVQEVWAQQPVFLPVSKPKYPDYAVGIGEQVDTITDILLNTNNDEDCSPTAVVIWGVGGIGKTTLTKAVVSTVDLNRYNYARIELDQDSDKNNYKVMQEQILKDAFPRYNSGRKVDLRDNSDGRDKLTEAFQSETNKPVFLFIDNALHKEDLEKILPEDLRGLPQRSRLVITTRMLNVTDSLEERGIRRKDYPVKTLSDNHAAEVLCTDPAIRGAIKDDLQKMLKLCNGIPLVLKMVAAHLSKQKYDVDRCTQILEAIQSGGNIKEKDLSNRLFDFVYNQLEKSTQEALLDICCFFHKGFRRRMAEYIVGAQEVASLQEAALITTVIGNQRSLGNIIDPFSLDQYLLKILEFELRSEEEELMSVHDIIQSIGRSLSKSSRLVDSNSWDNTEKDEGKLKEIKGIWLDVRDCVLEKRHINLIKDTIRILVRTDRSIEVSGTDVVRFPELRYMRIAGDISWVNVEALDKLAVLECEKLPSKQKGPLKLPESLRSLEVEKQPAVMQDFMPNSSLKELDITFEGDGGVIANRETAFYSRFGGLNKVEFAKFSFWVKMRIWSYQKSNSHFQIPAIFRQTNGPLRVNECPSLCELPEEVCRLRELNRLFITRCINLERLPDLFGQQKTLTRLDLTACTSLKELPESFGQLKSLTHLDLCFCGSLKELPVSFGQLKTLTHLDLRHCTSLKELPVSFGQLKTLTHLDLAHCTSLKELPTTFGGLEALPRLQLYGCSSLEKLPSEFEQLKSLTYLNISRCHKLKSDICLVDDTIKIVEKGEHLCAACWKGKKLDIRR